MLIEKDQVGKREQLANYITRVDAKNTPMLAMMPKGPPINNMLCEFQMDDFEDPSDIAVPDGEDAKTFDNASPNRFRAQTYAMKVRDTAMVSDLAENVSDVAGLRSELAESIMKKLEKVSRSIESFICGDQEQQAGGAGKAYKGRGLGLWIGAASGQSVLPVDSNYETPAGSMDNTAINSLGPDEVNAVLESSYLETGKTQHFLLLAGPRLKRRFSTFTAYDSGISNQTSVMRFYGTKFTGKIDNVVDTFRGDYGTVDLHTSLFNAHASFGGSAAANLRRGYLVPPGLTELCYKRRPRVKQLEDRGGGPRFLIDAIFAWKVKNPLALGKFHATTD